MVKKSGGALLLSLSLDPASAKPLSAQLSAALRDLILTGGLRAGDRLPATRTVAGDLGVSRTTVIEAFARLAEEGLVVARTGAGTYVSQALTEHRPQPAAAAPRPGGGQAAPPRLSRAIAQRAAAFDERLPHTPRAFTTALPAFDAFPMALWSRHVAKHWRARRDVVLGYGDAHGYLPLRRAVAAHLRTNRAIACEAEQIFIVNGAQHGFQLIADILLDPGDRVWFENPGAIGARNCFAAAGAELVPVPVDGDGLVVDDGLARAPRFRLAFVTPSHQQPIGSTMSLARRLALVAAAEASDAWVVEDDYDGEFCHSGRPPPTLKSIDVVGRVIYVGTFSKTLFPALRLGYVLVPPALVPVFGKVMSAFAPGVPSNPQAVVAEFMDEGHFAAHIRRMRKLYAERQQVLQEAARGELAGGLAVKPTETGLHTVALLEVPVDEVDLADRAWKRGVTVVPLTRFAIAPIADRGFALGFSGVRPEDIRAGARVLGEVLAEALAAAIPARAPAEAAGAPS
jgi:GntR family transcriptional regulator/MocR family aminotransferase